MNHFEELVAEYYEWKGCFVHRNIKTAPRDNGGYDGEIDLIVYDWKNKLIKQIEVSLDTYSEKKIIRFKKKFKHAQKWIDENIKELKHENIEREVILWYFPAKELKINRNIKVIDGKDYMHKIIKEIKDKEYCTKNKMISERFPLIRTIMFTLESI